MERPASKPLTSSEVEGLIPTFRVIDTPIGKDVPIERFRELGKFVFGTLRDRVRQDARWESMHKGTKEVVQRANDNRNFVELVVSANSSLFGAYFERTVRENAELGVCSVSEWVPGPQGVYQDRASIYVNRSNLWLRPSFGDRYPSDEVSLGRQKEKGFLLVRGRDVLQRLWLDGRQRKLIKKFADMNQNDILKALQKSFK